MVVPLLEVVSTFADAVAIANKSPNTPYIIKLKSGTTYELTYVNNTTTGDPA
jgi:hypothetical protein